MHLDFFQKHLSKIALFGFIFLHCSSLEKSPQRFISSSPWENFDTTDVTITSRTKHKNTIKLLYNSINIPKDFPKAYGEYLIVKAQSFLSQIQKNFPALILVSDKSEGYDLILDTEFFTQENDFRMIQLIRNESGALKGQWTWNLQKNQSLETFHLLTKENEKIELLKESPHTNLNLQSFPTEQQVLEILKKSMEGKISFFSDLPNVLVTCNGMELGKTPLRELLILNGYYECLYSMKNWKTKKESLVIEPEKERKIFIMMESKNFSENFLFEALPGKLKTNTNSKDLGFTPLFLPKKKSQTITFSQKSQSINANIPDTYFSNQNEKNIILIPYMIWDAFGPVFYSFWDYPHSPNLKFEMNSYLSLVNETNLELTKWQSLESFPFLPEEMWIDGNFFPAEETGQGIFQISFGNNVDYYTLEIEMDRVSLFHFPTGNKDIGTYYYPLTEKRTPRSFQFVTDSKKKMITIFLNEKKIFTHSLSFEKPWKILLAGKGNIFNRMNALLKLKIAYPRLLDSEQKSTWKQIKP